MLYTPLYYNKNNYERKENEINGQTQDGGCGPPYLPLHCGASQPLSCWLLSTLYPPCEQLLAAVVGGAVIVEPRCWSPSPCHHPYAPAFLYEQLLIVDAVGVVVSPSSLSSSRPAMVVGCWVLIVVEL
jgi:hypothetical protein